MVDGPRGTRRRIRRSVVLAALLILGVITAASPPASAHAEYVKSTPESFAIWSYAPPSVTVTVSEAVQPGSQALVVTNPSGLPVDIGPTVLSPTDPTTFSVKLAGVTPAVYTVVWSVISADDGHFTTGYFYFMVRYANGTLSGAFPLGPPPGFGTSPSAQPIPPGEIIFRATLFVSFAIILGGILFTEIVWRPSRDVLDDGSAAAAGKGLRAILKLGRIAGIIFLASILGLWVQALAGVKIGGPGDLVGSSFLLSLAIRVPLALGMIGLFHYALGHSQPDPWSKEVRTDLLYALVFAFVALGAESATSHSASSAPAWWPAGPLVDAMHLYGASLWVGGLVVLAWSWPSVRKLGSPAFTWSVLGAFSRTAVLAVALLVLGGILLAIMLVGSLYALFEMPYGWTVLVKASLLLPMVLIGASNRLHIRRHRKKAAGGSKPGVVHRRVRAEVVLGVAILIATAFLTSMNPPVTPGTTPYLSENAATQGLFALFQSFPYPKAPGSYLFTILMWVEANGSPYVNMGNATATLTFLRLGGGVNETVTMLGPHGPNHWYIQSDAMSQPGTYNILATFTRPDGFRPLFPFQATVYTPLYLPFDASPGPLG